MKTSIFHGVSVLCPHFIIKKIWGVSNSTHPIFYQLLSCFITTFVPLWI